jgi:hypothetical protein
MDLDPDLDFFTENMKTMAKYLIRRAQLKGPYELLGRVNVASDAWRKYEEERLECVRIAKVKEGRGMYWIGNAIFIP